METVCNNIVYKGIQALSCGISQKHPKGNGNVILRQDSCPLGIVHIVMNICNLIRQPHNLSFQCNRMTAGTVIGNSVSHLPGEIQPFSVLLQDLNHANTLLKMGKAFWIHLIQRILSCMTKGRMPQIMSKSNGFHQIFIQPQCLGNGTGNL